MLSPIRKKTLEDILIPFDWYVLGYIFEEGRISTYELEKRIQENPHPKGGELSICLKKLAVFTLIENIGGVIGLTEDGLQMQWQLQKKQIS